MTTINRNELLVDIFAGSKVEEIFQDRIEEALAHPENIADTELTDRDKTLNCLVGLIHSSVSDYVQSLQKAEDGSVDKNAITINVVNLFATSAKFIQVAGVPLDEVFISVEEANKQLVEEAMEEKANVDNPTH